MPPHDHVVESPIPRASELRDREVFVPLPAWPSWPWRKLVVTHVLAIVGGLLLAAVIYAVGTWDGHAFDSAGGGYEGMPVKVGQAVRVGTLLENPTDGRIVITKAALANQPSGIRILGVRLQRTFDHTEGWPTWPYRPNPGLDLVLPPHSMSGGVQIGLRATHSGLYVIHGIRVWYRSGFGLPVLGNGHWTQTTGPDFRLRVSNP